MWDRSLAQMLGIQEPVATPDVPYPSAWIIPQWRTDEILCHRLTQLGGRVELSTDLAAFEQDADGVTATFVRGGVREQVRAAYLVGADGGRSFVRKELGVGFAGETYESERTIIGDVRVDGPLDRDHCHLLTRAGSTAATDRFSLWGLPGTPYFQLVVNVGADEEPALTLDSLQRVLEERSGRADLRLHDLRWVSLYRVNVRMADRFRVGRVLLAGDAAHVHSPAGGQGLNAAVQDAYNLGWKLAAVLAGAPPALLDTYEAERMPFAADLLGVTTRWHRQDFSGPPAGAERATGHKLFQLSLNYRGGPLAWDDRDTPGAVRAGDRAPDAPCEAAGTPTRLFDVFRGPRCTLLAFGADAAGIVAEVNTWYQGFVRAYQVVRPGAPAESAHLIDTGGHIHHGFDIDPPPGARVLVLVRPDGYVGLVTAGGDRADGRVREYLERVTPAGRSGRA
ncbi:MAG TPA: FAD-dependent monooxygenase [Urbifossiella sp.]|nr:FAD-dependent monooxygenase [Urbifossiella sp.]